MTTTETQPNATLCACGCGGVLPASNQSGYKRGHKLRDAYGKLTALPGPGDDLDDAEALPDELLAELEDAPDWLNVDPGQPDRGGPDEIIPDPPPARLRSAGAPTRKAKGPRVTVSLRKDVEAKIRMVTIPLGGVVLQPRDPVCGGVFVEQEPAIAAALANVVCDSPDLLNFFTGPGGRYMKYFELFMACLPVGMAVVGHHVAHGPTLPVNPHQPQQQPAYAA